MRNGFQEGVGSPRKGPWCPRPEQYVHVILLNIYHFRSFSDIFPPQICQRIKYGTPGRDPKVWAANRSRRRPASRDDRPCGRAADGAGGREPDRCRPRRADAGSDRPPQRLPRSGLGDPDCADATPPPVYIARSMQTRASAPRRTVMTPLLLRPAGTNALRGAAPCRGRCRRPVRLRPRLQLPLGRAWCRTPRSLTVPNSLGPGVPLAFLSVSQAQPARVAASHDGTAARTHSLGNEQEFCCSTRRKRRRETS